MIVFLCTDLELNKNGQQEKNATNQTQFVEKQCMVKKEKTQSQYTPAFHYQSVNKIIEENLKLFVQRFKM